MRENKKIINSIKKNLGIYINNIYEFNNILNNNCIICGEFILSHINNIYKYNTINHNMDIIDIYCTNYEYNKLKLFLINNNFIINENMDISIKNSKYLFNNIILKHEYKKKINNNNLTINITITNNPIDYINKYKKLNIEKNYYNGVLLIILYPKNVILKKDTLYINNLDILYNTNIIKYLSYGYKIKLIDMNNLNIINIYNFNKYKLKNNIKNYIDYIKYKIKL